MFCCPGTDEHFKKGAFDRNHKSNASHLNRGYIPWVLSRTFHQVYQIGPMLGQGSFGIVHEVRTASMPHQYYAAKVIQRHRLTPHDLQHFNDEVQILLDLSHDHIIRLHEIYKNPDYFFVVMEKLNGGELFDRLSEKETYNEKEARDVCRIVFEAMAYCHDQRVAHRDLKPENLLLKSRDNDWQVKIADFGFAKRVPGPNSLQTRCGSPAYMAPEIADFKAYDERVDNWSMGVIVYTILGGKNPFAQDTIHMTLQQVRQANYQFKAEEWDGISPDAKRFITGLLTVDPNERLTMEEALLHPWMTGRGDDLQQNSINLNMFKEFNAERKKSSNVKSYSVYWLVARR